MPSGPAPSSETRRGKRHECAVREAHLARCGGEHRGSLRRRSARPLRPRAVPGDAIAGAGSTENASCSSAGAGCGGGFCNAMNRVNGSPTSLRGVLTAASAARYSGSRIRTFFRKMAGVAALGGIGLRGLTHGFQPLLRIGRPRRRLLRQRIECAAAAPRASPRFAASRANSSCAARFPDRAASDSSSRCASASFARRPAARAPAPARTAPSRSEPDPVRSRGASGARIRRGCPSGSPPAPGAASIGALRGASSAAFASRAAASSICCCRSRSSPRFAQPAGSSRHELNQAIQLFAGKDVLARLHRGQRHVESHHRLAVDCVRHARCAPAPDDQCDRHDEYARDESSDRG